ncbi:C-type lectin domain family 4 member F-like [Eriocheir sinensis]|uniref:C-type lectin domain family 4 member F-like n=1 Tax=Eriocheir sinensis TaxID=95602 RepID=UPI0021C777CB|nr:C-type lectin domain family 4 member F-like [Eriocheir sinensis]
MRQGFLVVLLAAVVAGRHGSLDDLRRDPTTLQEKTIRAIESLSHVLIDLQESLTNEGSAATPTEAPSSAGDGDMADLLLNLTAALQNHTRALLDTQAQDGDREGCPLPYWRLGDECFYVNRYLRVSWSEARHFCRGLGGDLAQPRIVATLRAALLMKYPEDHNRFVWVGASEAGGTEGNWLWMSGLGVRAEDWALDQPDGGNENCVVLSRDEHPSLHDSPCYTHTTFICQATSPSSPSSTLA